MARLGDRNHNSSDDDTNLLFLKILEATVHPLYNHKSAYFDIAVLVTEAVTFSKAIKPVCITR
jgi:hypothetical protein